MKHFMVMEKYLKPRFEQDENTQTGIKDRIDKNNLNLCESGRQCGFATLLRDEKRLW